ncbi:putative UDP-N-acetylglucosamine 1-carboxyvinyltransferase [Streptomyces aurantiacus JA 4570]|uniref:UDP-N-acetylglucosamine 1-carboxyvinyltransferase n=1 Tax=Streptomyces aurantiacus JA 4570 TaxID=1286094 RepID=S3ZV85_9ACTN|nr:putative UDP-N-acetylglucosamine 1-carboxyvinyltransferase [Streptomyces aurantiacus JA 4570]
MPGNKHSMVLGFAAAVTLGAELTLRNAPWLSERDVLARTVEGLGGRVDCDRDTVRVSGRITSGTLPGPAEAPIHGIVYLLPAVLAARGEVTFRGAGGDSLGAFEWGYNRPVKHMLEVAEAFGAQWERRDGALHARASRLRPATVDILRWSQDPARPAGPRVSGATKTALLLAAAAPGTSLILNPHEKEAPHELITVLRGLGLRIDQRDGGWVVHGGTAHTAAEHRLMPDPVETMTWQAFAALTGSTLEIDCGDPAHVFTSIHRELAFLNTLGIEPVFTDEAVIVGPAKGSYAGADLIAESTGISTDIAPLLAVLLLGADSDSVVEDRVWAGRYGYAEPLRRMGARMRVRGRRLLVGPSVLSPPGAPLRPADTRSTAVCLAAALATPGTTTVGGLDHLVRGYAALLPRLTDVGARIELAQGAAA